MRFTTIRPSSSTSKSIAGCDIYAVACDLQSQLHGVEERFHQGQELNEQLKRRKDELTEVLRLFQIVEANEVDLCNELENELDDALAGMSYEDAAEIRLDPDADVSLIIERSISRGYRMQRHADTATDDKENSHSPSGSGKPVSGGIFKPRVAIPPRWKKVIALSASTYASGSKATSNSGINSGATTTLTGTSTSTISTSSFGTPGIFTGTGSVDTASVSSTIGLCGGSSLRLRTSKNLKKLKRRGSDHAAKPYKTRTRSKSLRSRISPVLAAAPRIDNQPREEETGSTSSAGICGPLQGLRVLGGGGMWNAARMTNTGASGGYDSELNLEGESFRFVMST